MGTKRNRVRAGVKAGGQFTTTRQAEPEGGAALLSPGDVLTSKWGVEQTNVRFFRVASATGTTVTLDEIPAKLEESGTWGQGSAVPDVDADGERFGRRKIHEFEGKPLVHVGDKRYAKPWDGEPQFYSDYA